MIDVHCHLAESDYDEDRHEVIERCQKELRAVITCCAHPKDLVPTLHMVTEYGQFVFAIAAIHPIHVQDVSRAEKDRFFGQIRANADRLVGIGETGLDFAEVGQEWQTSQAELFRKFISLARELDKPLVIHSRAAYQQAIEILEEQRARRVLMHLFGARHLLRRVVDNGWSISVGPIALRSKTHKKIIRDTPLERLLLETDSPWFGPGGERNEPTAVRAVAERVARIKKLDITEVDKATTANAIKFFQLPL